MMSHLDRREFLSRTRTAGVGLAGGVTILANAASVRGTPANDKIIMAIVGMRGRGSSLAPDFAARGDCEFAYLCDVNSAPFPAWTKLIADKQNGRQPQCVQDFRKALDDRHVDAVVVATPDHWHVPAALWACRAGKDVYVEKPVSHNCWEGRKLVEAARKYNRVVQVGTQNRSAPYNMAARKYIADGKLGRIHYCRVCNLKEWTTPPMGKDTAPPQGFDWEMWNGPAPARAYNSTIINHWHHLWSYSGGDIANDASHQIDLARWLLGLDYPTSVYSMGGRFDSHGAAETPDTQSVIWEFPQMIVNFELTLYTPYMLKISPIIRQAEDQYPYWPQCATRIEIYGSEGMMYVGRHGGGWQVYIRPKLHEGVLKAQQKGKFPDPEHKQNFVDCIRSRRRPNADVEEGHLSALWIHYANISYRLHGRKLLIDPKTEQILGDTEAMKYFRRDEYRKPWTIDEA